MHIRKFRMGLAAIIITAGATFMTHSAHAETFNMPDQAGCDNGSTTLTWAGEGVTRPQIATMTVDGVAITDPANPALNSLGAVVCPSTTKGNRTSVSIIWHTSQGNTADLTNARTPNGEPVSSTTQIALTLNNLGSNSANFTFSLVYGSVSNWVTSNLATSSATVSMTLSPVRIPQAGGSSDFSGCTAVPPDCHATQSGEDVLGASVVLSFEPNVGTNMAGSYFALTGAMGGWVSSATNTTDGTKYLVASLGAPHYLADGTTLNTGNMTVFLPTSVLASLFGLGSADVDTAVLDVTRTTGSTTTSDVPFTITRVAGGAVLSVPTITFSSPKYTIKMTAAGLAKQKVIATLASVKQSSVKVIGKDIKANGKATYQIQVIVRNKFGKVIKQQPTFLTSGKTTTFGTLKYKNGLWTITVARTQAATKLITVKVKTTVLKTVSLKFVKA